MTTLSDERPRRPYMNETRVASTELGALYLLERSGHTWPTAVSLVPEVRFGTWTACRFRRAKCHVAVRPFILGQRPLTRHTVPSFSLLSLFLFCYVSTPGGFFVRNLWRWGRNLSTNECVPGTGSNLSRHDCDSSSRQSVIR